MKKKSWEEKEAIGEKREMKNIFLLIASCVRNRPKL
jgi:hypothetical protein